MDTAKPLEEFTEAEDSNYGLDFLEDLEAKFTLERPRRALNTVEWELRSDKWDELRAHQEHEMLQNTMWNMLFPRLGQQEANDAAAVAADRKLSSLPSTPEITRKSKGGDSKASTLEMTRKSKGVDTKASTPEITRKYKGSDAKASMMEITRGKMESTTEVHRNSKRSKMASVVEFDVQSLAFKKATQKEQKEQREKMEGQTTMRLKALQSAVGMGGGSASKAFYKVPHMSKLELFKYLEDWDKSSFSKRDNMVMSFSHTYRTREKMYDTETVFSNGGSLIFCRFCVGLQLCFLKRRRVWHYYDALGVFAKCLQNHVHAEEFLRLGGMNCINEVVRVEESRILDKLHACKFLIALMEGRNSHAIKAFIMDTSHFLESLIDSLTMCKDKRLIDSCGVIFLNLCYEIKPKDVQLICNYIFHALPCDFNPTLQAMAFRVLQSLIRLKPSLGSKLIKPITDNLKTDHNELLIEISNLSIVVLKTRFATELIKSLMLAAEGILLKESFKSYFRPRDTKPRGQTAEEAAIELIKAKEEREKVKARQMKLDHYMQQAGALFVINRIMTTTPDFTPDFINRGIFGLSLKVLGACPHWEVQGQGVTMVQFLHNASTDCAISYFLMLPPRMMNLILNRPEECVRYFTSPICVLLRKLGRFALEMWPQWLEEVVGPAKAFAKRAQLPEEIFTMTQMARTVTDIQNTILELLDNPVMEAAPRSPRDDEDNEAILEEFLGSSDEEDLAHYGTARDMMMGDDRFEPFREFFEKEEEYTVPEDKLDIEINTRVKGSMLIAPGPDQNSELDAYQIALLQDAEREKVSSKESGDTDEDQKIDGDVPYTSDGTESEIEVLGAGGARNGTGAATRSGSAGTEEQADEEPEIENRTLGSLVVPEKFVGTKPNPEMKPRSF